MVYAQGVVPSLKVLQGGGLNTLLAWCFVAVVIFAVLAFGVLIAGLVHRSRIDARPGLKADEKIRVGGALLEAIKKKSQNRKAEVTVSGWFWRQQARGGQRITWGQRTKLVQDLVDQGDIDVVPQESSTDDQVTAFFAGVADWLRDTYAVPPKVFRLTDLTWEHMMREGVSGQAIVIKGTGFVDVRAKEVNLTNDHVKKQSIHSQTAGRDITGSPFVATGGGQADVKVGDVSVVANSKGLSLSDVAPVVQALRDDWQRLSDPKDQQEVRRLASKIEETAISPGREADGATEDAIEAGMARAKRYALGAGGLMGATLKAVETWDKLRGTF